MVKNSKLEKIEVKNLEELLENMRREVTQLRQTVPQNCKRIDCVTWQKNTHNIVKKANTRMIIILENLQAVKKLS